MGSRVGCPSSLAIPARIVPGRTKTTVTVIRAIKRAIKLFTFFLTGDKNGDLLFRGVHPGKTEQEAIALRRNAAIHIPEITESH
jgi:hypothetical protein